MSNTKHITSVDNLKLENFIISSDDKKLIFRHKDSGKCVNIDKNSLSVEELTALSKVIISNENVSISDGLSDTSVNIGKSGNILKYVEWDESEFKLGKDGIIFDNELNMIFNGTINLKNLSKELLELISSNKGEPGPEGPPGEPGKDTSKYTWVLYASEDPISYNGNDIDEIIHLEPQRDSAYIGYRYNMDEDPKYNPAGRFDYFEYKWMRYKGDNAYSVNIEGANIFKINKNTEGENISEPEVINLKGVASFPNIKSMYWEVYNYVTKEYDLIQGTLNQDEINIEYASYVDYFNNNKIVTLRYVVEPNDRMNPAKVTDVITIYTLKDGDDSYDLISSNQMHTLLTDEDDVVIPSEYEKAYTDLSLFLGINQQNIKVSEISYTKTSDSTIVDLRPLTKNGFTEVRVYLKTLDINSDVITLTHTPTNISTVFSVYKAGDGKVRIVRVSGTTTVTEEGDEYKPQYINLFSEGQGGISLYRWEYRNKNMNDFSIIENITHKDNIVLETNEFFNADIDIVDFKAVYRNLETGNLYSDAMSVYKLDANYTLILSNPQDKVPIDTYNDYEFEKVSTEVSLYQGSVLVPINIVGENLRYTSDMENGVAVGDISLQSLYNSTKVKLDMLSDGKRVKITLLECVNGDYITINHVASSSKAVFSILMDDKYMPTVDIVGDNIFYYDKDGKVKPSYIELLSSSYHLHEGETIQWYYMNSNNDWIEVPNIIGNTGKDKGYLIYPDERWLGVDDVARFKVKYGNDEYNQDVMSVYKIYQGKNSKNLILSNETQGIIADSNGDLPKTNGELIQNVSTELEFYDGGDIVKSSNTDYDVNLLNVKGKWVVSPTNEYTVTYKVTDLTEDWGTVSFTRTYLGVSYTKKMVVFKNKHGANGEDGHNGIDGINPDWVTYVFRNSPEKPEQPKGIGLNPSTPNNFWVDAPGGDGTWWMSMAWVSGDTNLTITNFSDPIKVTGVDGGTNFVLDLSNENASVACDINGNVLSSMPRCTATLYFGDKIADGAEYSIYPAVNGVSINESTGVLSISALTQDTTEINVRADVNAYSKTKVMTITKVYPGADGKDAIILSLLPTANVIVSDSDGEITPEKMNCYILIEEGNKSYLVNSQETMNSYASYLNGIEIKYNIYDKAEVETNVYSEETINKGDKGITYSLYKDGVIIDSEGIPVIQSATLYTYYYMKNTTPNNPPSVNDINWSLTIPTTSMGEYLWMKSVKYVNGVTTVLGIVRISGEDGTSASSSYTHVKYSKTMGTDKDMTDDATDAVYMGIAITGEPVAPTTWISYKWTKIKGDNGQIGPIGLTGDDGKDGADGTNGVSSYIHIKYSPNSDGSGMGDTPMKYVGVYVDTSITAPSDYTKYTWSLFQGSDGKNGEDGIPGKDGTNGKTFYLFIRYSNDGGVTFTSNNGTTGGDYMGIYKSEDNIASSNTSDYAPWVKLKGDAGRDGPLPYLKTWNEFDTYKKTETYVDHVIYVNSNDENEYYRLKVNSSTTQEPPNFPSVWEKIDTTPLVATDTLLANNANLAEFIFKDKKLLSQMFYDEDKDIRMLTIDGYTGEIFANGGKFRGELEATKGLFSGSIKVGDNAGINGDSSLKPIFYSGSKKNGSFVLNDAINIIDNNSLTTYNSYFVVDDTGKLKCNNVDISGRITASSGHFNGDIRIGERAGIYGRENIDIEGDTVTGNIPIFYSGEHSNLAEGFYVEDAWYIINDESKLSDYTSYFVVDKTGKLRCNDADISGKITATSGSFTGAINATSGSFSNNIFVGNNAGINGNYSTHSSVLYSGSMSDNKYFNISQAEKIINGDNKGVNSYFIVNNKGSMWCNNVNVSGYVNIEWKRINLSDYTQSSRADILHSNVVFCGQDSGYTVMTMIPVIGNEHIKINNPYYYTFFNDGSWEVEIIPYHGGFRLSSDYSGDIDKIENVYSVTLHGGCVLSLLFIPSRFGFDDENGNREMVYGDMYILNRFDFERSSTSTTNLKKIKSKQFII